MLTAVGTLGQTKLSIFCLNESMTLLFDRDRKYTTPTFLDRVCVCSEDDTVGRGGGETRLRSIGIG